MYFHKSLTHYIFVGHYISCHGLDNQCARLILSVLNNKVDTVTRTGSSMATLIGQVEAFQLGVGDWELYTERLEQYFVANGITEEAKKLAVFLTVIGSKTYALLSDLLAPVKPATKSYTELLEVLKNHLKPKPVIIAERFHFHQRQQKEGEGVAAYMAALRRLADKCEYGTHLEEALRDRFICGLCHEAT